MSGWLDGDVVPFSLAGGNPEWRSVEPSLPPVSPAEAWVQLGFAARPCECCGKSFRPHSDVGRRCRGCVRRAWTCPVCKRVFVALPRGRTQRFCSKPCANEAMVGVGRYGDR